MSLSEYKLVNTDAIETPCLLAFPTIIHRNIDRMAGLVGDLSRLRPHIKTHKMPRIAQMQLKAGAAGITTAKIGEAEVMAAHGIDDIFIANQIAGEIKYKRLRELNKRIKVSIGIDSVDNLIEIQKYFRDETKPLDVLVEIEVGENRSGVVLRRLLPDAVQNLNLQPARQSRMPRRLRHTQKNPAVGARARLELDMQVEIPKCLRRIPHITQRRNHVAIDMKHSIPNLEQIIVIRHVPPLGPMGGIEQIDPLRPLRPWSRHPLRDRLFRHPQHNPHAHRHRYRQYQ